MSYDNTTVLDLIREELERAQRLHPPFPTIHHGIGVIYEEWEEVKREAFKKRPDRGLLASELLQLAAMCARMLGDLEL